MGVGLVVDFVVEIEYEEIINKVRGLLEVIRCLNSN